MPDAAAMFSAHAASYDAARRALIPPGATLHVRSKMHEAKLFFDGPVHRLDIGFGDVLEFTEAAQPLTVLGIATKRKWGPGSPASGA